MSAIFRKEFKFAWNTACSIHKINLLEKCENCNKPFMPHKITYTNPKVYICTNCKYDLRTSKLEQCNLEVLELQEKLNMAIYENCLDINFPLKKHTIEELFKNIRILLSFLRALFKTNKYDTFLKKLNISIPNNFLYTLKESKNFEDMSLKNREFFLLIISRIFKFNIEEIKKIFENMSFSHNLVANQSTLTSETISYLSQNLKIISQSKRYKIKKKEIIPKSIEEVKLILQELKQCL